MFVQVAFSKVRQEFLENLAADLRRVGARAQLLRQGACLSFRSDVPELSDSAARAIVEEERRRRLLESTPFLNWFSDD